MLSSRLLLSPITREIYTLKNTSAYNSYNTWETSLSSTKTACFQKKKKSAKNVKEEGHGHTRARERMPTHELARRHEPTENGRQRTPPSAPGRGGRAPLPRVDRDHHMRSTATPASGGRWLCVSWHGTTTSTRTRYRMHRPAGRRAGRHSARPWKSANSIQAIP